MTEEENPEAETHLNAGEMKPEDVVQHYDRQTRPYVRRARRGPVSFVINAARSAFFGGPRPSVAQREARQEIDMRRETAREYSERNLPVLKAQAKIEAEAGKTIHIEQDPPKVV